MSSVVRTVIAVPASIVPEDNRCAFAVPPRHSAKKTVAIKTEINVCLTIAFSSLNKECNRFSAGEGIDPVDLSAVGAVYDRAFFPAINEIRAVIDRAYSCFPGLFL